ncbi:hypothetical protein FHS31_001415 [Sphingomonas vulcanisoli]|uniref:Cellulose-binding protein n=1 Tax=Sphingomonas vulcanisoli TaxID=1658060 RepID=A0ABX0TTI4_9SPHN|nr:hypothetical protein [Sphingomonas vulcanisoli]NIJ07805.1 hypothetical protein [Sphingomonas vulcanisoli]
MKIGSVATGLIVLALAAAPIVRHRLGWADAEAQTRPTHGIDPAIVPPTIVGMNLGLVAYYNSEDAFADPVKSHGAPFVNNVPLAELPKISRDDGGHPIDTPAGTTLLFKIHDGTTPFVRGTYRCTISPGWRVEGVLGSEVSQSGTKFTIVGHELDKQVLQVNLTAEKNGAALTNLACRYPDVAADAMFRSDYLADMRPFRVIRFMDWMRTNNQPHQTWAIRPTPQSLNQIDNGVALEHMVELANQLHSDPWFTLPWDADEEYYRNFATYVRDHLDPGLKAYVELSNEVWNDSFTQSKDATAKGEMLYPGVTDDKANDYYYADRVRALMMIWGDVYKGQEKRIVRVMASQLWAQRGDQRLGHKDSWKYVDALAIAPYWGDVPNDIPGTGKARIDATLAKAPSYIDKVLRDAHDNKVMAAKYGLPVIAYEGGPGFNAFDPAMTKDMTDLLHDPRLYDLYMSFLRRWQKEIGGTLVLYQGIGNGFWGHLDYTGQPLSDAPKMRAVVDFIHQLPGDQQPRAAAKPAP